MSRRRLVALALGAALTIGAAGCVAVDNAAPGVAPTTARPASPQSSPAITSGPIPSPTVDRVRMPSTCDDLATDADVASVRGGGAWILSGEELSTEGIPGPRAQDAAANAASKVECLWWPELATESFVAMRAYLLDDATRTALVSALEDSSEYTWTTVDGEQAFTHTSEGGDLIFGVVYVFADDVWFVVDGTGPPSIYLPLAEAVVVRARG